MSHCKKIRDELRRVVRDDKRYNRRTPGGLRRLIARNESLTRALPQIPMSDDVRRLLQRIDRQMHAGDLYYDLRNPMVGSAALVDVG